MLGMDLKTFIMLLAFGLFGMWFFTEPGEQRIKQEEKEYLKIMGKKWKVERDRKGRRKN